jgi:hypothetical protein
LVILLNLEQPEWKMSRYSNLEKWSAVRDIKPCSGIPTVIDMRHSRDQLDTLANQILHYPLLTSHTSPTLNTLLQQFDEKLHTYTQLVTMETLKHGPVYKPVSKSFT